MDIVEMQKKKAAIEHTINDLLNSFEDETFVKINDIDFERGYECNKQGSFIYNVKLDIRL
jgi:hypothetical protein